MPKSPRKKETPQKEAVEEKEEVEIPPDILDEEEPKKVDNAEKEDEPTDIDVSFEEKEEGKSDLEVGEPSFYEKVTGEKPPTEAEESIPEELETSESGSKQLDKMNKKLFFLGGAVFLLTVVVASIVGLFLLNSSQTLSQNQENEATEEQVSPTPTPMPAINKEDWTFEVLNGSGIRGAAADAEVQIEALGYEVLEIGNAEEQVSSTQVFLSEGVDEDEAEVVLRDLEDDFGRLSIEDETADSEAKIRIVIGSDQP